MARPAYALFENTASFRADQLVGQCRLAVQAIRPLANGIGQRKYPWLEFLIRPCGPCSHLKPFDYVRMMYESPLGLGLDEAVCTMVVNWLRRQPLPYRASINIHPASLARPEFAATLIAELEAADIAGDRICLELVEFTEMVPVEKARGSIERLKSAGIKLAIDDYGRGMPCFELYGAGVIDYIKIDRAYIKDICSEPGHVALLKGILSLARELNAEVVAEGVEHESQHELLTELGVPWAQGYLFEKPRLIEL